MTAHTVRVRRETAGEGEVGLRIGRETEDKRKASKKERD